MLRRRGRTALSLRRAQIVLPVWVLTTLWMWSWWLNPANDTFLPIYIPLTLALIYEFAVLPSIFMYFVFRAKVPKKRRVMTGQKVAVVSLCVPSQESLDIVESQLKAMSEITYPHDSWILDEGNSKAIKQLARKYGVKHFSRRGIPKYNQDLPPFKSKTKAGNVNAWLNHVKRRKYDYFVQLDIDHIPLPSYLDTTLGHFRDKNVAWVQAPSVYKNLDSWVARGSAEQELVLQGPLQMGFYGHSETPFIIGSHCTYRTSAIMEIGGFQPTRAEDHLDTVMLANKGYKGVFIPEVIASGDGPESLATYLAQQFAWAYSMFQVLIYHTPTALKGMPLKRKWQFLFAQTWYPLWSVAYAVMFLAPIVGLLINKEAITIQRLDFLTHFIPMFACTFLVWWAARPIMQPAGVGLTWRGMILHAVRWPILLRAIFSVLFKVTKPYMITPKGKYAKLAPVLETYKPFLVLGIIGSIVSLVSIQKYGTLAAQGQMVFALTNAMFMLTICLVDIDLQLRKAKPTNEYFKKYWLKPVSAVMVLAVLMSSAFVRAPFTSGQIASAVNRTPSISVELKPIKSIDDMTTSELIEQIELMPVKTVHTPPLGIYSPRATAQTNSPYIQHTFADWRDDKAIARDVYLAVRANNTPLVTIEPRGESNGDKLLRDISNGYYDKELSNITRIISASNQPVYVRFAHEMELAELYPWGDKDSANYILAYRYVINYIRNNGGTNSKWVWSPAGNNGAEKYYPGDEYVDVVGTTILYDRYFYGYNHPTFDELARRRSHLFNLKKPVWIVEFGVGNADPEYQAKFTNDGVYRYGLHGYSALVYLNIADSNIIGPDYRLRTPASFTNYFEPIPVKLEPINVCFPSTSTIAKIINSNTPCLK